MVIITNLEGKSLPLIDIDFLSRTRGTNGDYEITLVVRRTEKNAEAFKLIEDESLIKLEDGNKFRIKDISRETIGNVTKLEVTAQHSFYDRVDNFQYNIIPKEKVLSLHEALTHALDGTDITFYIEDDFENYSFENFGDDTSIALFNKAKDSFKFEFDIENNTHLRVYKQLGSASKGIQMRWKQNIVTIKQSTSTNNLSTYIKGYGKPKEDDEGQIIEGEYEVETDYTSPNADKYGIRHAAPYSNDKITDKDTMLRYLKNQLIDYPEHEFEITYENLKDNINIDLEDAELGDMIYLVHEPLNLNFNVRILEVTDYPLHPQLKPIYTISSQLLDKLDKQTANTIDKKNNDKEINNIKGRQSSISKRIEKAIQAVADVDNAMIDVNKEMDRIENEVIPEVESAVDSAKIPSSDEAPYPIPTSKLWWDTSINPPRLMKYNSKDEKWEVLAPSEDEIDDIIQQMRDEAVQESKTYTEDEIRAVRQSIVNQIEDEIGEVNSDIGNLQDTTDDLKSQAKNTSELLDRHGNKITDINTDIDDIEGRITASIKDIEKIDDTVTSHSNEIQANAQEISAKLDSTTYQSDKTDILSEIEKNTTDIKANSEAISARVTKEEFEDLSEKSRYRSNPLKFRYIRDWSRGSSVNSYNHWIEIKAIKDGVNIALNKPVTSDDDLKNGERVTDGEVNNSHAETRGEDGDSSFVIVDLEEVYDNIEYIHIWHYFRDNRRYYDTKTEVSEDGENWIVIFDSKISGEYDETEEGRAYSINSGYGLSTATERITKTEATLDIHSDKISAKAEKSELTNYVTTQTYTNKVGQLDVSIDNIMSAVSKIETDVDKNSGDITSARSRIAKVETDISGITSTVSDISSDVDSANKAISKVEQKADSITSTVSKIETDVSGLDGDMKSVKTDISQMPDKISLAVSEGIDGIEVGGRNLIPNADFTVSENVINLQPWESGTTIGLSSPADFNAEFIRVQDLSPSDNDVIGFTNPNSNFFISEGETYTLSFLYITSAGARGNWYNYIMRDTGSNQSLGTSSIKTRKVGKAFGSYDVKKATVTFTANFTDEAYLLIGRRATIENTQTWIRIGELMLEKGSKATDWSLAIEDQVNKTNVLSSVNLSKEGIKIEAEKVDIQGLVEFINKDGSSSTMIDGGKIVSGSITANQLNINNIFGNSAVIGKIQSDSVKTADLSASRITSGEMSGARIQAGTLSASKITSGTLDASKVTVNNINAGRITGGTLNANNIAIHGGSGNDYTRIDGAHIESRGTFRRTWQGNTSIYDIRTMLQDGYLRFRNETEESSLYFSWNGISTYRDGEGGDEEGDIKSSGTINWWDREYDPNSGYRGITIQSAAGSPAIVSLGNIVNLHPNKNRGSRRFQFRQNSSENGYLTFGTTNHHAGFRFEDRVSGRVALVDEDSNTGGTTRIEAGTGRFNVVERRAGTNYLSLQNENYFRVGLDASDTARVVSDVVRRRTYSSGANVHVTGEGTLGRSTSASKYKNAIKNQFESTQEQLEHSLNILKLNPSSWYDKYECEISAREAEEGRKLSADNFKLERHVGLIAENVRDAGLNEHVVYHDGEVEEIAYDRLWIHLIPVVRSHEETIEDLKEENAVLKGRVKLLENQMKQVLKD